MDYTNEQIEALAADLRFIKGSVAKHDSLLRAIILPRQFAAMSLAAGVALIAFSAGFQVLAWRYGGYAAIPPLWRSIVWAAMVLFLAVTGVAKRVLVLAAVKDLDAPRTTWGLMRDFVTGPLRHLIAPVFLGIVGGGLYLWLSGGAVYVFPLAMIGYGVIGCQIGGQTGVREYVGIGYWMVASSLACLPFCAAAPFLAPGITLGLGLVGFGVVGRRSRP
jgi:hypothetical protein